MKYQGGSRCCQDYVGYITSRNATKIDQNLYATDEN